MNIINCNDSLAVIIVLTGGLNCHFPAREDKLDVLSIKTDENSGKHFFYEGRLLNTKKNNFHLSKIFFRKCLSESWEVKKDV